jgi:hypothetical protein
MSNFCYARAEGCKVTCLKHRLIFIWLKQVFTCMLSFSRHSGVSGSATLCPRRHLHKCKRRVDIPCDFRSHQDSRPLQSRNIGECNPTEKHVLLARLEAHACRNTTFVTADCRDLYKGIWYWLFCILISVKLYFIPSQIKLRLRRH